MSWRESKSEYSDNSPDLTEDEESSSSNNSLNGESPSLTINQFDQSVQPSDDEYPGVFEGPEKTMEVVFRADVGAPEGLRSLSRNQLDELCTKARCSIMSSISNSYMDAYVLSESSLFVYRHRLVMKTCGTTTLLVEFILMMVSSWHHPNYLRVEMPGYALGIRG
jgi:hypothetical protein